jgi:hypothetical protein
VEEEKKKKEKKKKKMKWKNCKLSFLAESPAKCSLQKQTFSKPNLLQSASNRENKKLSIITRSSGE